MLDIVLVTPLVDCLCSKYKRANVHGQSRVGIEHYSIAYFDCITTFDVLWRKKVLIHST